MVSRCNFFSFFSPLASPSFNPFQNIPVSKMINHRLRTSDILLHFISFSDYSYLNIIEFGVNNLNEKDTLSISNDSLFTNQSLPYFIIFYLHNSISLDPKILDQVCLCINSEVNGLGYFVVNSLQVSLLQRFDVVFDQLKDVSISNWWKEVLSALWAFFICVLDCYQTLPAIGVLVMASYNRLSFICIIILHANAAYKQTSINLQTISFALSCYFLIINFSRLTALISLFDSSLLFHQLLK